ncbi:hypothetical protein GCM10009733_026930 [Nonomuraea maheshkhaliensis]|uniref:Uncharacterized protein n=1 Tax=Nonomuraea maheshkhaliensis TaxID=419590 RepID=A0ABP4R2V7_9ACTN
MRVAQPVTGHLAGQLDVGRLAETVRLQPAGSRRKTVAAIEDLSTEKRPCRHGDLVLLDTLTGKKRKGETIRGLDPGVTQVYLRTWLSEDEVTVLTTSVRCRAASEVPDDEPAAIDPPYRTMTAYAVNVRTGQARRLAEFRAQGVFELTLPGPPGAM